MLSSNYFDNWNWTREGTLRLAEAVPETDLEFCPAPGMMPLGELTRHICGAVYFMIARYLGRAVEIPEHIKKKVPLGRAGFIAELKHTNDLVIKLLSDLTDADLPREIQLPDGTKSTVGWVVFHLCEHEIHHRAQLKMVLKLKGIDTSAVKL
jgi:uncharacterized damage-inducible protein DinB